MTTSSSLSDPARRRAKDLRRLGIDEIDRRILHVLADDARIPNAALASAVGIAPSTCHVRVQALRASGVIQGFHTAVDLGALGRGLEAMIAVRLQSSARARISDVAERMTARREVMAVFLLAGADDLMVHVAVHDTQELRAFVLEHLSTRAEIASTETSLVFEHLRSRHGAGDRVVG